VDSGLNAYSFCDDDPVNFVDPFGLCPEDCSDPWAALGKVTAITAARPWWKIADDSGKLDPAVETALMMAIPAGSGARVEQYALRAVKDGLYPVMRRGFAEAVDWVWLRAGDVWKYGTTKNPLTRYSAKCLSTLSHNYGDVFLWR
jgi:hypothetical protein